MESDRVTIRISRKLMAAVRHKAKRAGLSIGEYLRQLAEQDTDIPAEMKHGLAGADKATRKRVSEAGHAARAGAAGAA